MYLICLSGNGNVRPKPKKNNRDLPSFLHVQVGLVLMTLCLLSTPGEGNYQNSRHLKPPHRCFVCLPQDKTSMLSKEILDSFPGRTVPDCASFPNTTAELESAHEFQLPCPKGYSGCLLRISGMEVSRTCSPVKLDDCKIANSIELCYCSDALCNSDKVTMKAWAVKAAEETTRTSRHFHEGETDDEDLLTSSDHHHQHYPDDDQAETGSGHFVPEEEHQDNLNPLNISSFSPSHSQESSSAEEYEEEDNGRAAAGGPQYPEESIDSAQEHNETMKNEDITEAAVATASPRVLSTSTVPLLSLTLSLLVKVTYWRNI